MNYGLTDEGFETKRLQTIKSEIEQSLRDVFGSINTDPDSVFGQIIGVMSKVIADLWEEMESVYYSQYPESAESVSLDSAVTLTGIVRLGSTQSTGLAGLKGTPGTSVPANSVISVDPTGEFFLIVNETEIQNTLVSRIFVNVVNVIDATVYTVTIDGTPYDINSGAGATKESIGAALVSDINATSPNAVATDYFNGSFVLTRTSADFTTVVDSNLAWLTPSEVLSLEKGSISAPQGSLINIETPISGWDSVNNFQDVTEGRDEETDAALRLRRAASLQISGAGTPEAIRSRIIQNVDGVVDAFVVENETVVTDGDGRPPKSFETIVSGGLAQDIGDEIWLAKPAGIQTYGTEPSVTVIDSQGNSQTIFFSRPADIPIYMDVDITLSTEEIYPDNGDEQVQQKLIDYIDTLTIGNDVLYQKLFGVIYEVPGIASVVLLIDTVFPPATTVNIAIGGTELAVTDISKVVVSS